MKKEKIKYENAEISKNVLKLLSNSDELDGFYSYYYGDLSMKMIVSSDSKFLQFNTKTQKKLISLLEDKAARRGISDILVNEFNNEKVENSRYLTSVVSLIIHILTLIYSDYYNAERVLTLIWKEVFGKSAVLLDNNRYWNSNTSKKINTLPLYVPFLNFIANNKKEKPELYKDNKKVIKSFFEKVRSSSNEETVEVRKYYNRFSVVFKDISEKEELSASDESVPIWDLLETDQAARKIILSSYNWKSRNAFREIMDNKGNEFMVDLIMLFMEESFVRKSSKNKFNNYIDSLDYLFGSEVTELTKQRIIESGSDMFRAWLLELELS